MTVPAAALLLAVLILIACWLLDRHAERRHRELMRLLEDLATMLGELFERKE